MAPVSVVISQNSVIIANGVELMRRTSSNSSTLFVCDLALHRIRLGKFVLALRVTGFSTGGGLSEVFAASLR